MWHLELPEMKSEVVVVALLDFTSKVKRKLRKKKKKKKKNEEKKLPQNCKGCAAA